MRHEKRVEIRWSDVDAYMHVNNAVYAQDLEECRDEWVDRALGELGDAWDFVLARVAIDFRRELRLEDEEVIVSCTLDRIGNSSVTLSEEIRTRDGELSAEAEAVLVARDRDLGRSRPLTEAGAWRRSVVLARLSSPLAIGPVELPNRIVSTAHQTTLVHEHLPTDDFVAYHEARARGGVGLIVLEATAIHESGLLTSHTLGGYLPAIVEGYRRVAAAVRPHGTRLFVQLFHGGREQIASAPRSPALAPSAVPSARFRTEPRAARAHELEEIVAGFAVERSSRQRAASTGSRSPRRIGTSSSSSSILRSTVARTSGARATSSCAAC